MDFDTVYDRLDCPHTSYCVQQEPIYSITTATKENKLALDVECNDCHGADHLMFDVGSLHRPNQLENIDVGDEFVVNSSDLFVLNSGDQCRVTAIADNPLYASEKPVVGIIIGTDTSPPYRGHLFELDKFQNLIGKEAIQPLDSDNN